MPHPPYPSAPTDNTRPGRSALAKMPDTDYHTARH